MNSLWLENQKNSYDNPTNDKDFETEVCIVGGGIFGITCAYYLSNLGFKVAVLEKDTIGSKTTGHTTGKITSQHSLFYKYLTDSYGKKFAKDYLEANERAIENIKRIIDTEKINCDFKYENSYVYATTQTELDEIMAEYQTLQDLGFNCELVTKRSEEHTSELQSRE